MTRDSEGVHIVPDQAVVLHLVLRIVEMPPDIRIGDAFAGEREDQGSDQQRQHDRKGDEPEQALAPRKDGAALPGGLIIARLVENEHAGSAQ